jgi:hypothetical protein
MADSNVITEDQETIAYCLKVQEMEGEKAKAVMEEDYMRAGQIKQFITDLTTAENLRLQLKAQLLEEEKRRKSQLVTDDTFLLGTTQDLLEVDDLVGKGHDSPFIGTTSDDGWFADGMLGSTDLLVKALHEEAQNVSKPSTERLDMTDSEVITQTVSEYSPTQQELCQDWANRMKAAAMSYLGGSDASLDARKKALNDAVVVGSGVVLGNPSLLGLHLTSLLTSLHRLPKETSLIATPFSLEVAARWFHQSSTRKLAMLGTIQVG